MNIVPANVPTGTPTSAPIDTPTDAPTGAPTSAPTDASTDAPTSTPTSSFPTSAPAYMRVQIVNSGSVTMMSQIRKAVTLLEKGLLSDAPAGAARKLQRVVYLDMLIQTMGTRQECTKVEEQSGPCDGDQKDEHRWHTAVAW